MKRQPPATRFVDGPPQFESFDVMLERTMAFNPTRSRSSLRRGVLHNARERDDGTWVDRPGRATVVLRRSSTGDPWMGTHTHFSLVPVVG